MRVDLQGSSSLDVADSGSHPDVLAIDPGLGWLYVAAESGDLKVFDIGKPWPIRAIEQRVAGGLGIMLDDIAAAFYAAIVLLAAEGVLGVRP